VVQPAAVGFVALLEALQYFALPRELVTYRLTRQVASPDVEAVAGRRVVRDRLEFDARVLEHADELFLLRRAVQAGVAGGLPQDSSEQLLRVFARPGLHGHAPGDAEPRVVVGGGALCVRRRRRVTAFDPGGGFSGRRLPGRRAVEVI